MKTSQRMNHHIKPIEIGLKQLTAVTSIWINKSIVFKRARWLLLTVYFWFSCCSCNFCSVCYCFSKWFSSYCSSFTISISASWSAANQINNLYIKKIIIMMKLKRSLQLFTRKIWKLVFNSFFFEEFIQLILRLVFANYSACII
jgi:hypothetical protein